MNTYIHINDTIGTNSNICTNNTFPINIDIFSTEH